MSFNRNHSSIGGFASLPTCNSDAAALPPPATQAATVSQHHRSTFDEHRSMLPSFSVSFKDIIEHAAATLEQTGGSHQRLLLDSSEDEDEDLGCGQNDVDDRSLDCILYDDDDDDEGSIILTNLLTTSSATVVVAVIYGTHAWISNRSRAEASKQALGISGVHKQSADIESTLEAAYWICCSFFFTTMLIAPAMTDCGWGFPSRGVMVQKMRAAAALWESIYP
ncbi:hypothetical protein HWV62_44439 [Athelia sp. TMB]|nr:hypothetical protein HWV62_44439 [Athelia sp. TMB]